MTMSTWELETPHEVVLRVTNVVGTVTVSTHDRPVTTVEVAPGGAEAADLVARTRVEQRGSPQRPEVVVEVPDGATGSGLLRRAFADQAAVAVTVRVPQGSTVEVTAGSADVRVGGDVAAIEVRTVSGGLEAGAVRGDVRVRTASGDVAIDEVGGRLQGETASGDVRVGRICGGGTITTASGDVEVDRAEERVEVRSASGDVRIREVVAGARVQTASGDQDLERLVAGDVRLESVSGNLLLGVAPGTALHVDAQSVTGDLSSDIDLDGDGAGPETGPRLELAARTVTGDVRLRRAAAS